MEYTGRPPEKTHPPSGWRPPRLALRRMVDSSFMHPAVPHLIDLQAIDLRIALLRAELEGFPKMIRDADTRLTEARAALASAKEAHTSNLKERKTLELDAQQWLERARKYREQSGSVKTNEAYRALQHETANAEAEAAKVEDRQLEKMMTAEEVDLRVKNGEKNLQNAEKAVEADKKKIKAQADEKKRELEAALAEREKHFAPVPEDLRDLYTRIAKRHNGHAMAEARDGQCRGCGLRVLPHILQELHRDASEEIYRCENCGLILYSLEPQTAPKKDPPGEPGGQDSGDLTLESGAAPTR